VIGVALLVGLCLAGTGYAFVARRCDGLVTLSVVAAPDHSPVLSSLAQRWSGSKPAVNGHCARVEVVSRASAQVAGTLTRSWDARRDGRRPDVWAPDASTWVQRAAARPAARDLLGSRNPSVARTPVVLAMPRPMAEALGWPDQQLGWLSLLDLLQNPAGWTASGHPEWGAMRLGVADPARDTAGLSAVLAIMNYDGDTALSQTELAGGRAFARVVTVSAPGTAELLTRLAQAAAAGTPLSFLSVFPATERDVIRYNATGPAVPLAADYPPDGTSSADHPYVVLRAPWVDSLRRAVADRFLDFVRGPAGRVAYADDGFRPPDGAATGRTTEQQGLLPAGFTERDVPGPAVIGPTVDAWSRWRRDGTG
jgi:Ca-activated chloride channel family protein